MTRYCRVFFRVLEKDILLELRSRDIVLTMGLFSFLSVIVFSFAFLANPQEARRLGGGMIWVVVLYGLTVGQSRLFEKERENAAFTGIVLTPAPRSAIFLAKVAADLLLAFVAELLVVPLVLVFFDLPVYHWGIFLAALLLGTVGATFVGCLFAAMLMSARLKEVLLPVAAYPLLVPVVIAGVKTCAEAFLQGPCQEASMWLRFLLGFDMVFGVAATLVFASVVEAT